ncbi:MAG TPA: ATP-binding protein [Gammaproteobacteria bacterium]|nr:ATP-binding protein [Gammaproteobacteria bacterium]
MRSLYARLLAAATIVVAGFLSLTGLALDQAFRESALTAMRDRLQTQVYMLLSAASFDKPDKRVMPVTLPDPRLSTPGSGLYAQLSRDDGTPVWRSNSLLGNGLPPTTVGKPGMFSFYEANAADGTPLFELAFKVRWEAGKGAPHNYIVQVAETAASYEDQLSSFRRSLRGWLAAAAAVLLLMQVLILRWGLRPLRQVAEEVTRVENGKQAEIRGDYPTELGGLVTNLNALIRSSAAHLERYRRSLGDLAHSFKTPLAVLRGAASGEGAPEELRQAVKEQVRRLDHTVAYQLQRAAASGRRALAAPLPVAPLLQKVQQSLAKVYADKHLQMETRMKRPVEFFGDESDLLEILGNLADNACKWARRQVRITVRTAGGESATRPGLIIEVEDDGPSIPPREWQRIFERGYRADTAVEGHGIGLAIVHDLVGEVYHGRLEVTQSDLGGACVRAHLRF